MTFDEKNKARWLKGATKAERRQVDQLREQRDALRREAKEITYRIEEITNRAGMRQIMRDKKEAAK